MKTMAWDVDDVLNDLLRAWFDQAWRPRDPTCAISYEQLTENPPHAILGTTIDDYRRSLDAFRLSDAGADLPPNPLLVEWFRTFGPRARHLAISAVPLRTASRSAAWVMRHFGRWIRTFHVVPTPRDDDPAPEYEQSKAESLKHFRDVDVFVDDTPCNLAAVAESGVKAVAFPRPWNANRTSVRETLGLLAGLIQ